MKSATVSSLHHTPTTGAAMDRVLPADPRQRWLRLGGAALLAVAAGLLAWRLLPSGLPVSAADIDVATVHSGTFRDELVSRANVAPLSSIMLDATEGGRVEAVLVKDGATVTKGELLFRLSNPQREQELMARSAEVAQQVANLSTLRAQLAASRSAFRRDIAGLEFELDRSIKTHQRNAQLGQTGFLSGAAVEESADKVAQQRRLLDQVRVDGQAELGTREQSIREMDQAIQGLSQRLSSMRQSSDAMAVRAPVDGRLTGFALQEGESVKPNDRVGRVDSPDRFKLIAKVDEFYLSRVTPGLKGSVEHQGKAYALAVSRTDPQVKDGRFNVELQFEAEAPAGLQSGQGLDSRITLGQPGQALLLPDGAFYADSGGAWVFALDVTGTHAARRSVRLGRRAAGSVEVLGGLSAGDKVITSGYARFGEAQTLRID